jgi:hypothetical protein
VEKVPIGPKLLVAALKSILGYQGSEAAPGAASAVCWRDYFCTRKIICVPLSRCTFEFGEVSVAELEFEVDDVRLRFRRPITP